MATVGSLAVVLTASATDFERTLGRAARAVKSTEKEFMRSARNMERIGRAWTIGVTAPILAGLSYVSKAAIDWEDAFAGVRKTVDATEEQFTALDISLRKMTERIPLTHREIAQIAESAGQLGIQVGNIESFTETMAMMGTSTVLTSENAAIALAQMDNIMQSGQKVFDRYSSTIVHLGNNLATFEDKIVDFGLGIAGAGKIAGLTEPQVLAIAGAFSSVGIEAEAGGTAVSKVLQSITESVATGNEKLAVFAATAGMSAAEFATAWQEDAGAAFARFVEGLGASGNQAFAILRELGLTDQRLLRAFLSVADAQTTLTSVMDMANKAWEENTALVDEANKRYRTGRSRLIILGNKIRNAAINLGIAFAPMLEAVMDRATKLIEVLQKLGEAFANLPAPVRTATGTLLLILAAIGPAYLAFAMLNKIIAISIGFIASIQSFASTAAFAFASWRLGAATLGESLVYLAGGPIKAVILGIGAAIAVAVLLILNWDKLRAFAVAAWNAISAAVLYGASLVVRGIGLIITAIGYIIPAVRGAGQALIGLADSLKASAGRAISSAKSAASSIANTAKSAKNAAETASQVAESQKGVADAGENAAKNQDKLAKGLGKAGKAANANIQSFDEVHQLQESIGDAAPSAPALDAITIPEIDIPEISDVGIGGIGDIAAGVGDQLAKVGEKAASVWNKLKQAMEPVNKAVQWIKANWPTIGPIIEGIASLIMVFLLPALIKSGVEAMIAAGKHVVAWALKGWAAVVNGAKIVGQLMLVIARWAWAGVQAMMHAAKIVLAWALQGWAAVANGIKIVGQLALIVARWAWAGIQALINAGKIVLAWVLQGAAAVAQGTVMIGQLILIAARWAWAAAQSLIHAARMAAAWVIAMGPIAWVIAIVIALAVLIIAKWDWIKEKTAYIWNIVSMWISNTWDSIKNKATNIFNKVRDTIANAFNNVKTKITNIWNSIYTWVTSKWTNINNTAVNTFNRIKNSIIDAFNNVKTRVSTIWNNIWSSIRNFINKIISGINTMIRGMNKLKWNAPSWVPVIGGKSWGINIPTIPYLATGTNYVPQDMVAYLHEGEAVVPKKFNPAVAGNEADADAMAQAVYRAIMDAFRIIRASSPKSDSEDIVLKLDSKELARLMLPALTREAQRRGYNLVLRGV